MDFAITLKIGLGDIILVWAALENSKNIYNNIYIDVNWSILELYKSNSDVYRQFVQDIIKLLFTDNKYKLFKNKCGKEHSFQDLIHCGIYPALPKAQYILCDDFELMNDPYIVITTKVRQYPINKFNVFKDSFIEIINSLSQKYKIVLLGEKEVENNSEYDVYGPNHIYSLYSSFINCNNVLDLTQCIGVNSISLKNIMKDCSIMNKAAAVITVGCGGNLTLAAATAKCLIGARKDDYEFGDFIYKNLNDSIYVVKEAGDFLNKLKQL